MNTDIIKNIELKSIKKAKSDLSKVVFMSFVACFSLPVFQILFSSLLPAKASVTVSVIYSILVYSASFLLTFGTVHLTLRFLLKLNPYRYSNRFSLKAPLVFVFGTIGITYILTFVIYQLFPNLSNSASTIALNPEKPIDYVLYIVFMAVLPAILEEYAFRHVIFSFLLPYGKWGAVICSALLFGISHIEPHKIITATVFGVFLAVFRAHTGSLVFPIIIHFINNLISVLTLLFPENIALNSSLNVTMYLFITSAFILLFYILFIGISKKQIPLSLRQHIGYSLPLHKFIFKFVFNVGFIPFLIIYSFYIYLSLRL